MAAGFLCVKTELAECYPQAAHLKSAIRSVWLDRRACVVVADEVQADHIEKLTYHWHAHPDAALWVQQGWALLHFAHFDLWVTSPLAPLSDANILRLPGSRGQLTLSTEMGSPQTPVWWIFAIGDAPPRFELLLGGRAVQVAGKRFEV